MVIKFFRSLVKRKILVPVLFLVMAAAGMVMQNLVSVNYDLASYLPEHTGTKRAIEMAKQEFDYLGTAQVMARNVSLVQATEIKQHISDIPGVKNVLWLDDVADIKKPLAFLPEDDQIMYYKDGSACFYVTFVGNNYDETTSDALVSIRALDESILIAGEAESSRQMKSLLSEEMPRIVSVIIPICVLLLIFASNSWIEPFMYLFVIGLSIAVNMGTNLIFNNISFITVSMAAILQLALSMDYSIFLTHRYFEERDKGLGVHDAVAEASEKTFSSISASALTTIAGFVALVFMQYRIGADMGLVLAKGILLSFVTVMLLMPVLIVLLHKWLDKTRHKRFMPRFGVIGRAVVRWRFAAVALAVLVIVPSYFAQSKTELVYGDTSLTKGSGPAYEEYREINDTFGSNNAVVLLVPTGDPPKEKALTRAVERIPYVSRVTSLAAVADNAVPEALLPEDIVEKFRSENYSRLIAYINFDEEREESFMAAADIRVAAEAHYPGAWYAAGRFTSLSDIRDTVEQDSFFVMLISIAAVGIILLLIFRSLSIPLILLLVIQGAIWINMAIPYYTGFKMAYVGFLVISSMQLGATIDYGILLYARYSEFRLAYDKKEAAMQAIKFAGPSILTSALILAAAGFGYAFLSTVGSIAELGMLLGRGAIISALLTILVLPALLVMFDQVIAKTTLVKKGLKA